VAYVFAAAKEEIEDEKTSRRDEDEGTNIRIVFASRTRLLLGFPLLVTHSRLNAADSEYSNVTGTDADYSLPVFRLGEPGKAVRTICPNSPYGL